MSIVIKENEIITVEDIKASHLLVQNYASVLHIFDTENDTKDLTVDLGLGSSYVCIFLQKNNNFKLTVNLNAPKAKTDISSVFLADEKQKSEVYINHNAPDTYSNQLFKGLAWKNGLADITLKTTVREDLKSIEAYQLLRGIVLADTAEIKSAPLLDIYSDDVICSHGSAIGTLSPAQIFYMQSRGINKEDAIKFLIKSFTKEVIDKVENETIQSKFLQYTENAL